MNNCIGMKHTKLLFVSIFFLYMALADARAGEIISWEECAGEADKNHPDLVSAREKVKEVKADKEIVRSAVIPQVTGNASELTSKSKSIRSEKAPNNYEYGATAKQLLFDGFKSSYDLSEAARNIEAAKYDYDVTSSNVRLRLRTAYVNLLTAEELLKVTEDIEARRRQNLELVKLRYEGGREHKGAALTSDADLAEAVFEVNQAKRSIYLAERQLIKELGRKKFVPLVAAGDLKVEDEFREMPDFEAMAESTPFLKALIAQKEAAKFGLSSAKAGFFPTVYAEGGLSNTDTFEFPRKNEWSFGANLTLPIFDGGSTIANVSKAKASLGQAQADELSGRDTVILTLSDTWTKLQDASDKVAVELKFLEAATERARIAESEYSAGLLIFDNWIIIEDDLVSAKKNYLNAERSAMIAEANWIQAKGGTLEYDRK